MAQVKLHSFSTNRATTIYEQHVCRCLYFWECLWMVIEKIKNEFL